MLTRSSFREGSKERLLATFLCAQTLVHEIGHAVVSANIRNNKELPTEPANPELWIENDVQQEYGVSMIGWLFGGKFMIQTA